MVQGNVMGSGRIGPGSKVFSLITVKSFNYEYSAPRLNGPRLIGHAA